MKDLYQKLRGFSGKKYGLYKSLTQRSWNFGDFSLDFIHVQGDPYAPPSRIRLTIPFRKLNYPKNFITNEIQGLAMADYLLRRLAREMNEREECTSVFTITSPGQEILFRNTLCIGNFSEEKEGVVEVLMGIRLPGENRLIDFYAVSDLLTRLLPDILLASLYGLSLEEQEKAYRHIETLEIRNALLDEVLSAGFIAFIPNGAILPRASGISDLPAKEAVSFNAPKESIIEFTVRGKTISGMGISKGITAIAGGAYHGKSTLLSALEKSVYPHIPGDGREWVVVDPSAFRVRSEEGRLVRNTRIAPLVRELPGKISTESFFTVSASGSTSEAANLLEALECGVKTILIDEDVSAVNFLIRDQRMRRLLGNEGDPLIPLIERIREFTNTGVHFILVIGACGDFLTEADRVIVMKNYLPEEMTASAKTISSETPYISSKGNHPPFYPFKSRAFLDFIKPLAPQIRPSSSVEKFVKVRLLHDNLLQVGFLQADVHYLSGFCNGTQRYAAGLIALNLVQSAEDKTLMEVVEKVCARIEKSGFGKFPQGLSRDMTLPRAVDIAAVLLRLRTNLD